jgi:ribonuclease T1
VTTRRALPALAVALLLVALLAWLRDDLAGLGADPSIGGTDPAHLPVVELADLPSQARDTVELIDAGGPFPHPERDGATFGNFEGILPDRPDGYYEEFTVPTPGSDDRGERRIVAGEEGELYWTGDHYESFARIER